MDGPRTPTIPTTELWDKIHELCDELESPPTSPIPSTIHLLRTSTRIYGSTSSVQVMDRSHDDGLEERAPSEHAPVDPNDPNTTQPPSYGPPSPPCYAVGTTHPSWIEITHVSDDPIWNPTNPCLDAEADSPPPQSPSSPSPSSSGDSEASQPNENDTFDRWQRSQSCAPFPSELSPLEETLQSRTSSFTPTPTAAQVAEDAAWDGVGRLLQAELEAGRWVRLSERPPSSSSSPYASDITASSTVDEENVDRWYSRFCPPIEEPMYLYTPDSPDSEQYWDDIDLEEDHRQQPTRSRTSTLFQQMSQYRYPPQESRLPPEVLHRIFQYVKSDWSLRYVRYVLPRIALVCQEWRVQAECVLYEAVALYRPVKAWRFIDSRQEVTRVKRLVLDSEFQLRDDTLSAGETVGEVLPRCWGLEELSVKGYGELPFRPFFEMPELANVSRLTLKDCHFFPDYQLWPINYEDFYAPSFFAFLTHLTLEFIIPYIPCVIKPILAAASTSLRSLCLQLGRRYTSESDNMFDDVPLPEFEQLISLTLSGDTENGSWFLPHCVALRGIHFRNDCNDIPQALCDLPQHVRIRCLSIPTYILQRQDDWDDAFDLPCMQSIGLVTFRGVDEFLYLVHNDPEYVERHNMPAWKQTFQDFCSEREREGVNVEGDSNWGERWGIERLWHVAVA